MNLIQRAACGWLIGLGMLAMLLPAGAQPVQLGEATYFLTPKGNDKPMPRPTGRTEALSKTAAQTNQWYSTLLFNPTPEVVFAIPLTVKFTGDGLEVALPKKEVVPTVRRDVEIHYPHRDPLRLSPAAFESGPPKLAAVSDWAIDVSMARGADDMRATVAHGSPFVSVRLTRGDLRVQLPEAAQRLAAATDPRVLVLRVKDQPYALFGPTDVRWEQVSPTEWVARLPAGKGYVSVAPLPDDSAQTLALFTRHAYAFVTDTRVAWNYDAASSQVTTTFTATTQVMEGEDHGTLLGLYPHHWFENASVESRLGPAFDSLRGSIRLLPGNEFKTVKRFTSFVPFWPGITDSPRLSELEGLMRRDARDARRNMLREGRGPYWQGKGLLRTLKLVDVFEQQGDIAGRDRLLNMTKNRTEEWFGGGSRTSYFHYDAAVGSVASYPDEYFAVEQINDHHFHYGYWIRAAAEIALRDPAWAAKERWGGMVDLLVAEIATAERGRADFPFLRTFDPYEGHSWASGIGLGEFGNNQESSSEAINAWAGLILWGEVTGNTELRDLGIYLFTTEVQAINHYWFDVHGLVFPPEYMNVETSMVFGGKYAHNTWWTDEPRQIKGINLLPITTASTYLGWDPKYVRRNIDALEPEMEIYRLHGRKPSNPPPDDVWQDIFSKYLALAEPDAGLAMWNRWGSVELGESRTHTLHFMLSLEQMGPPDFSVTADTTLYAVFRREDGRRTHLAFNATGSPITVRFSDGVVLEVSPRELARAPQAR